MTPRWREGHRGSQSQGPPAALSSHVRFPARTHLQQLPRACHRPGVVKAGKVCGPWPLTQEGVPALLARP